jgi:Na+/phosphate symporter
MNGNNVNLQLVRMYGILIAALAVLGLFVNNHLFQLMNTDIALDGFRVLLAGFLLYVGFVSKDKQLVHNALLGTGILYLGMGLLGLITPTFGGLLPTGLTGFDVVFHLVTGALATVVAMSSNEKQRTIASH